MKSPYVYRFFLTACFFTTHFAHARFDQAAFDQATALYGNKTANLMELEKITAELNQKTPGRYAVPAFFGISHTEIRAHLETAKYSEEQSVADYIDAQWEKFKKVQSRGSTTLASTAQPILKTIRDTILQAFNPATYPFIIQDPARKALSNQFISMVTSAKKLLMVRSTGREDSKELANAGGNESVSSVPPEIKAVTSAIGIVVESYFSEKSLGQRLLAKDTTIFDKDPFLPVLQQIMIGEQVGGAPTVSDIPTSGVMFSQEAEGRTPGVTHIQATWGHNEGVVNGLVPVDSFYVSSVGTTDFIHPIVRIKQNRLVTMRKNGKNVLERKLNPRAAQRVQCLTPQDVIDLKNGADAIVKHYNQGPYDIEFVILNGVINWVQARPITHKVISPSYLKNEFVSLLNDSNKQSIYAIGAGGGKTHIIDSESAVIITDNIRAALSIFLKREDKDQVKAIVVGEMAPATSHEATTFRAEGVPVLYSAQVGTVKTWAKQANNQPLLIDPQREQIALFTPSEQFPSPSDAIKDGWFAHPISKKVSVLAEFYQGKPKLEAYQEHNRGVNTSQLIAIIKNSSDATEVTNALESILFRTAQAIKKQAVEKTINPQLLRNAQTVFGYLTHSAYEVQQAFDTWSASPTKTEQNRLARLYPIVFFEALIKQVPAPQEFVNDYSLVSLIKIELIEKRIVEVLELTETKWKEYLVQYAKAADVALTDGMKKRWNSFVKSLETIPDEQQVPFVRMMFTIATLELMPLWLNISFAQKKGDTQKIVAALLDEFNTSQEFLKKLQEKAQQMNEINMANWGEPDKFPKQWEQFKTDILSYFILDEFIKTVDSASALGKNGAAAVMNKFVDTFDRSIKELKASKPKYSNIGMLIERFKAMLDQYLLLLKSWATIIPNELSALLDTQTFTSTTDYISKIYELFNNAPIDVSTLEPSSGFNVAAAALGSQALWSRSIGDGPTLEDVFTLIHQNLLVVLGQLVKMQGIDKIDTPQTFKTLSERLNTFTLTGGRPTTLVGANLTNKHLVYFYNQPIRNHSNTMEIEYDFTTRKTSFEVTFLGTFFGGFSINRWKKLQALSLALARIGSFTFKEKPVANSARGFFKVSWVVDNPQQAKHLARLMQAMAEDVNPNRPQTQDLFKAIESIIPDALDRMPHEMITMLQKEPVAIFLLEYLVPAHKDNIANLKKMLEVLPLFVKSAPNEFISDLLNLMENWIVRHRNQEQQWLNSIPNYLLDPLEYILLNNENEKLIEKSTDLLMQVGRLGIPKAENQVQNIISKGIEHKNPKIRSKSYRLLQGLASAKKLTDMTLLEQLAQKTFNLEDPIELKTSLQLYAALVKAENKKAYKKAYDAAKTSLGRFKENKEIIQGALAILGALINKNQYMNEIKNYAYSFLQNTETEIQKQAMQLVADLIKKETIGIEVLNKIKPLLVDPQKVEKNWFSYMFGLYTMINSLIEAVPWEVLKQEKNRKPFNELLTYIKSERSDLSDLITEAWTKKKTAAQQQQ